MDKIRLLNQYIGKPLFINTSYNAPALYFVIPKELREKYLMNTGDTVYQWRSGNYVVFSKTKYKGSRASRIQASGRVAIYDESTSQRLMAEIESNAYIRFYDCSGSYGFPAFGCKLFWLRENCAFCHSEKDLITFSDNCICKICLRKLLDTFKDL